MVRVNEIKALMIKNGYNQKTLAKAMNVSENTMSSKLSGKSKWYVEEADLCCKLLNIRSSTEKAYIFLS